MQSFFLIFFIQAYVVGSHFELPQQVEAIQMGSHNTHALFKEVVKSTKVVIQRLRNCLTVHLYGYLH